VEFYVGTSTSSSKSTRDIQANQVYKNEEHRKKGEKGERWNAKKQLTTETPETTSRNLYSGNEAMKEKRVEGELQSKRRRVRRRTV